MRRFNALACLLALAATTGRADDPASRVVVLANRDDEESLRIAQHYMDVRGIPADNLVALPTSRAETISWPEFVHTIWEPLRRELVDRGWIDAIAMSETDRDGRTEYVVSGHRISYLVVCRGVPLRIPHDPQLYAPAAPFTDQVQSRTNAGAVDSELSLLAYQAGPPHRPAVAGMGMMSPAPNPNYAINAYVPNPLFNREAPDELAAQQIVKVSRLDGPTVGEALALVDRAVEAERTGLLGRAYIDVGGPNPEGDRWLEAAATQLEKLGFDTDIDHAPATIPAIARFDAPVLYFGWYAGSVNGPFDLPGFRFPPGAVAFHIHSYSAATLHSASANWAGPFVARGVTATVGNVFEPFLGLTHRPDLMLRALARGETFGDAVYYSLPALSWETIAIGDPLYRPFAVSFDEQWKNRAKLPPLLAGYAVLRKMNLLDAANKQNEATGLMRKSQREEPSFAVGLALALRLKAAGQPKKAAKVLEFVPLLTSYETSDWALAHEAAQILTAGGQAGEAERTYKNLFHLARVPRELRRAWLPDARASALAANDRTQAETWEHELNDIDAAAQTGKN